MNLSTELVTSQEFARYLGIHEDNVRKSRCTGVLLGNTPPPHYKIRHRVYYKISEVKEWIERMKIERRHDSQGFQGISPHTKALCVRNPK